MDTECTDENKVTFPFYPSEDVTLFAKWVSEMYTITYNSNGATGGTEPETVQVEKGSSFVVSANIGNLTKTGYAFTKWATSTDGTSGQTYTAGDKLTPSKNMTLYAQWGKDYVAMVTVPGGNFYLGDPNRGKSRPKITLSSFQIAQYELTYELWLEVYQWAKDNGYNITSASKGYEPVYYRGNAVWKDDTNTNGTFKWDQTKNGYRLPTECEWEFAAGGGSEAEHDKYIYAGSNTIGEVAWYCEEESCKVGTKKPNALGLYDMIGNVSERCFDNYEDWGTGELHNPVHWSGSSSHISRGGSLYYHSNYYDYIRENYTIFNRNTGSPVGIRVARNAD